ncbi:winged helix-turn-helix domain-containing protein [Candidatus Pelagibacter sp.]|nr:winged helix-turn-helix domain-containing protein [Candidatus Pelagibacter sp.]
MSKQILIIYNFPTLYHVLEELDLNFNFTIFYINGESALKDRIKNLNNYLVISNKKYPNISDQFILNKTPIKILSLFEKINIKFLKLQFNNQSKVKINNYVIDLNARIMSLDSIKLKLTEKEVNTIIYLSKSNNPVSIDELQNKVWSYQLGMETHTVETHIYRLRKKILDTFKDGELIINKHNGYHIKSKKI